MTAMDRGLGAGKAGVFTRASSGLVRQVSTFDTFIYCLLQAAVPYILFTVAFWAFYPGASMELAILVTIIGAAALGIVYALFSSVYPRSGGEYVFLSRSIHPALGFVCSFSSTFWQNFYFGINGAFASIYGISPFFTILGLQLDNQTLINLGDFFAGSTGYFLVAAVTIIFFGYQLHQGMRTYFRWQKYAAFLAFGGLGVTILVMALGSAGVFDFQANFNALAGSGSYQQVLSDAQATGTDLNPAFDLGTTAAFMIWPAFSLLFAVLSVSFSGEIKNVKRGQLFGIVGAVIAAGLIMIAVVYFARQAISNQFLIGSSVLAFGDNPEQFPLPAPWLSMLASITGNNLLLTILINLSFVILTVYVAAVTAVYASRGYLAWALDGMAPSKLADVSDRYHSPTYSILLTVVVALVLAAIYSFTDWLAILSGLAGMGLVFLITGLAGIVFPYLKRDVYETSPSRIQVGPIPLISLAGVVAAVFIGYVVYRSMVDDTYGANSTSSILAVIAVYVIALIWFYAARWYRTKQGVDVSGRFEEIPIE